MEGRGKGGELEFNAEKKKVLYKQFTTNSDKTITTTTTTNLKTIIMALFSGPQQKEHVKPVDLWKGKKREKVRMGKGGRGEEK